MNLTVRPELIQEVIGINRKCSAFFNDPGQRTARKFRRAMENYFKMWTTCGDGRVNIPNVTQMPLGVSKYFRNIGGRFNLEWEKFDTAVNNYYLYHLKEEGKGSIVFLNYHKSKGSIMRGCKGFNYDEEAAIKAMYELREQFYFLHGKKTEAIIPLVCGLETDEDALIFHGSKGHIFNLALVDMTLLNNEVELKRFLQHEFKRLYPWMLRQAIDDLVFIARNNLEHIQEVRRTNRPITELVHTERAVILGRGADLVYEDNFALRIGMYSDEAEEAIREALGIVKDNLESGRIDRAKGFVLMSSASYGAENGLTPERAILRAKGYRKLGLKVVKESYPEMQEYMHQLTAISSLDSRQFKIIE